MNGKKNKAAQDCAILLAEVFGELNIPCYIMGFSYDWGVPTHRHYVNWANRKTDRYKLLGLKASGCNFDSFSIRYAGGLLKRRKEEHKLLIVLSDGTPTSGESCTEPYLDTVLAVKDVRKFANVLGIGMCIDDNSLPWFYKFYGHDFTDVQDVSQLCALFAQKVKDVIKKW